MKEEFDLSENRCRSLILAETIGIEEEWWYPEKKVKEAVRRLKEKDGVQQIQDNLEKSFKGTFKDAMKSGYDLNKHYVIVDWKFFHELLEKKDIDKIFGKELTE